MVTQDCSDLIQVGRGKFLLCRLLRPTLGKKFLIVFAILSVTGIANWLVIDATLSKMRGMTAIVNVTGSLRWLSQRIHVDTMRIANGDSRDRALVDAHLARLEAAIRSLESGGIAHGIEIQGLPDSLQSDIELIRQASVSLRLNTEAALQGMERGLKVKGFLDLVYEDGTRILGVADAIAGTLTDEADKVEKDASRNLQRLGLINLVMLMFVLALIRSRIILPIRKLADISKDFARGQRDVRSSFRSFDEIGQLATAFNGMADEIQRDLAQLAANAVELKHREQGLRKFSLAIEHSQVSVLITDAKGVIEYVNPKFIENSGYSFEEVVGRTPAILKSRQVPEAVYADLWKTVLSGRDWQGELLNLRKDGQLYWENSYISPLKDDNGRITHFVAIKEDITQRKRAEESTAHLNAELERRVAERTRQLTSSNRELEAFSYSISHDLRAPLRGINGFASLMAENCKGCGKSESLGFMARIQRASVRMGNLIDDMLDLSRVARSEIRIEPVNLSGMARSICEDMACAEPDRLVQVDVQDGLSVNGDANLLQTVLENLLGNAWKFSSKRDTARIVFGCNEVDGEGQYFVRDNGAGFDMKYAGKLFGTFQRLHGPQEFEGNGIGLAMVRRIITMHGGRTWAESVPNEGATFYFTLGAAAHDQA